MLNLISYGPFEGISAGVGAWGRWQCGTGGGWCRWLGRLRWWCRCPSGHGLVSPQRAVFAEPPPRLMVPGNITASPGQDVVMSCPVLSAVPYNLTWSWDGKAAQPGDGRTRLLQNHSLEISRVQPGDGGLYECVARSAHGTATASLWLFIQGSMSVENKMTRRSWSTQHTEDLGSEGGCSKRTESSEEQMVAEGSDVTFTCEATGSPAPAVTWMKDGKPLAWQSNHISGGPRLSLVAVGPADAGVYSCLAANEVGEVSKAFHLLVSGACLSPGIWEGQLSQFFGINEGTSLSASLCPHIRWEKDGHPLNPHLPPGAYRYLEHCH
uniref:Ig-like domain-containing protein n=1 Tax=Calidris pygmaea TaxID=425635 RepID=A0A8C3K8U4_9CHAR